MTRRKEKRKHNRFKVNDSAFAFINEIPFTIHNISKGGVKLQSVLYDDIPVDEMLMDILLKNDNLYLQDIPVRLIRFHHNTASSPFSNVHVKCFGLQFGELSDQQKTRLDHFISQCKSTEN